MRKIMISSLLGLALIVLTACSGLVQNDAAAQPTTLPAVGGPSGVIAEGRVVPIEHVSLAFETPGTVAEILVAEGDIVAAGTPLARLDTRDLDLRVEQAQMSLAQAQADYDKLLEGATPEQVAAAEAEIARAEGSRQATQASVTQADIAAARAELESAKARLAQLEAGAKSTDIQSAQASVDLTQANLQSQRDTLSIAKTQAESQAEQAAFQLTQAQARYAQTKFNWEYANDTGNDPLVPEVTNAAGQQVDNKLSDGQRENYYAQFVQAEAAMREAEKVVTLAVQAAENARQAEITGIQSAEAQLRDAEARLEKLLSPADADAIASAQAQVASAQAKLVVLTGDEREANLVVAEAGVASAQARLDEINAKPSNATLAGALARVRGADVSLRQARLALEKAALVSPIGGSVAELNIKVGEVTSGGAAALVIVDLSNWQIETEDLTELNVVRVREGDQVAITFDAIDGLELPGIVSRIEPVGENRQGDIVYNVTITPNSWDDRLRWNMTASVRIGE